MPEVSRFFGIVIRMYFDDHNPPHFHAEYGSEQVVVDIANLSIIAGKLPPRAIGLVAEWASSHQAELSAAWLRVRNCQPPGQIAPLE